MVHEKGYKQKLIYDVINVSRYINIDFTILEFITIYIDFYYLGIFNNSRI